MCPFCSMFLAQKLKEWQQKLNNIPVIVVVTRRQEYRCAFRFMIEKPYYQGFQCVHLLEGWMMMGLHLKGLKELRQRGGVVQYAFQPEEIYPTVRMH